jgi:Domain of unknown function (DUF4177)
MARWEYRVVSFQSGYTAALNEYGNEGWELVSVVPQPPAPSAPQGGGLPMPRTIGRIEEAANKITGEAQPAAPAITLLWVLRRPLEEA